MSRSSDTFFSYVSDIVHGTGTIRDNPLESVPEDEDTPVQEFPESRDSRRYNVVFDGVDAGIGPWPTAANVTHFRPRSTPYRLRSCSNTPGPSRNSNYEMKRPSERPSPEFCQSSDSGGTPPVSDDEGHYDTALDSTDYFSDDSVVSFRAQRDAENLAMRLIAVVFKGHSWGVCHTASQLFVRTEGYDGSYYLFYSTLEEAERVWKAYLARVERRQANENKQKGKGKVSARTNSPLRFDRGPGYGGNYNHYGGNGGSGGGPRYRTTKKEKRGKKRSTRIPFVNDEWPELIGEYANSRYYVVFQGAQVGVFGDWRDVKPLVDGVSGNVYQAYRTFDAAAYEFQASVRRGEVVLVI